MDFENPKDSKIVVGSKTHSISEFLSLWWRKPAPVNLKYENKELDSFIFREVNDTLFGIVSAFETCGKTVINHPFKNFSASIKPSQLLLARKLGLIIPATLVTNHPASAQKMIHKTPSVSKGVSMSWALKDNKNYAIYVNEISEEQLNNIENIKSCPATIQEKIRKKCDVRITVVGNEVFYFKVKGELEKTDWREEIRTDSLTYEHFDIDEEFKSILLRFNGELGLKFSAFDFVLGEDNVLYFLECNPNGQWLWLDYEIDGAISDSFVEILTR